MITIGTFLLLSLAAANPFDLNANASAYNCHCGEDCSVCKGSQEVCCCGGCDIAPCRPVDGNCPSPPSPGPAPSPYPCTACPNSTVCTPLLPGGASECGAGGGTPPPGVSERLLLEQAILNCGTHSAAVLLQAWVALRHALTAVVMEEGAQHLAKIKPTLATFQVLNYFHPFFGIFAFFVVL